MPPIMPPMENVSASKHIFIQNYFFFCNGLREYPEKLCIFVIQLKKKKHVDLLTTKVERKLNPWTFIYIYTHTNHDNIELREKGSIS